MSIKKNEMQHFLPAKSNLATDAYEAVSDEKVLMLTMANKHTKT
jgi:hypothetical protein